MGVRVMLNTLGLWREASDSPNLCRQAGVSGQLVYKSMTHTPYPSARVARCSSMGTNWEDQQQEQRTAMVDSADRKHYRIKIVDEDVLPAEQDFVFFECDGDVWLAFKRTKLTEPVLEDAWSTFRATAP